MTNADIIDTLTRVAARLAAVTRPLPIECDSALIVAQLEVEGLLAKLAAGGNADS